MKKIQLSKGVQYMLISTFCFSAMQSFIKFLPQFDSFQHIFFRSVIGWILSVSYLVKMKISLKGKNVKFLIMRGLVGSVSMFSFFYILTHIPFGSSVAFKYLSPIFTAIFAVLFLSENISKYQWFFYGITFLGILLLKGFDARISLFDAGIGLLSAVSGGLLFIVIRKIGEDDHQLVILHYFMFISAFFSGIVAIQNWRTPTFIEMCWFLLIGVIGFFAQNFFTKSIQEPADDVSFLAILRYSEVLYALVIGYVWFGEVYTFQSFLGIVLIFTGLILSFRYKSKHSNPKSEIT